MRVGVIFAIYNCEEYVDKCLEPWFRLREKEDFILTVTSGRFKDYVDLGIPNKNKSTLIKLANYEFDYMVATGGDKLLDEDTSRNTCLEYLKHHNCDLIWLVDGDEFYTVAQIKNILSYVEERPDNYNFEIYFKNYTIDYPYFIGNWFRPTLYRNNINGGIGRFYFDSYFSYADNITDVNSVGVHRIPRHIAFIDHLTWIPRDATKDKILYQNSRYNEREVGCRCAYEWKNDKVVFSESFWNCRGLQIPILNEYPTPIASHFLFLNFVRNEDKITIKSEVDINDLAFVIKDIDTEEFINSFPMSLIAGIEYYMIPVFGRNYDNDPIFRGFRIEVYQPGQLIHVENLILK
jgi:hypothetical protein